MKEILYFKDINMIFLAHSLIGEFLIRSVVDPWEDFGPEGVLKDIELALVDLLGLEPAAGQHQLAVEVPALEHGLEGSRELGHVVKVLIVLQANSVLFQQVGDEIVLPDVHLQVTLQELKVGRLEARQEVLGGVLGIFGTLSLSTLFLLCGGLGMGLGIGILGFLIAIRPVDLGDLFGLPERINFVGPSFRTCQLGGFIRNAGLG